MSKDDLISLKEIHIDCVFGQIEFEFEIEKLLARNEEFDMEFETEEEAFRRKWRDQTNDSAE